jgi:hypothetical protein
MPAPTRSPQVRPPGAPAYCLARPAACWLTALHPPRQSRTRPAPARPTAG